MSACTANLLDSKIDYEAIENGVQPDSHINRDSDNFENQDQISRQLAEQYKAELILSKSNEILDISRLMIIRMQAGYLVDSVHYNYHLSSRFLTC